MNETDFGLYVHIPFCSIKCFYCDFAAFSGKDSAEGRYLAALDTEASLWQGRRPTTLYVGGGTPSELSLKGIDTLFAGLEDRFGKDYQEATFEAHPESLTEEKLALLKRRGITRVSLGLQTPDDVLLKAAGRHHTAADFLRVYRAARDAGFDVSVDLMHGLPGQDLLGFLTGLEAILDLDPTHLSLYGLQVEDRTLFAKRNVKVDEDLGRVMFEKGLSMIASAGLKHYEIANFARPGHESVHNRIYWKDGEYLGLGCSAASYLGGLRSSNTDGFEAYIKKASLGVKPTAESERLTGKEKLGETVFLGLRLIDGMDLTEEMESVFAPEWSRLESAALITRRGRRVRLTREGVFLANRVFSEFVAPFPEPAGVRRTGLEEAVR